MKARVGIIDYGAGNFGSVWNAVSFICEAVQPVTKAMEMKGCSHIILPGVGSFPVAMRRLDETQMKEELLSQIVGQKVNFLGICVGMQILATLGTEFEDCAGLGLIEGKVRLMDVDRKTHPLPHMGWNSLSNLGTSPILCSSDENDTFYFVHSYHFDCTDPDASCAFCEYEKPFVAAVSKENIHGVQFHPEKSQNSGIRLLKDFLSL